MKTNINCSYRKFRCFLCHEEYMSTDIDLWRCRKCGEEYHFCGECISKKHCLTPDCDGELYNPNCELPNGLNINVFG